MSDPKRTAFAMQALGLAETFNLMLQAERVKGPVTYRVELSAPEGMSTAGGKQATQHVKLVPEGGGTTIVAGSANQAESWAELRTFEHLKMLHAQRWKGAEIPLNRVQYNELLEKLKAFFAQQGHCAVRMAELPRDAGAAASSTAKRGTSGALVMVLILVAALAAAAGVTWFLTHRPQ
ncbi:MAG TPA: hypothetical protein VHB97_20335 [Polyangia bacterium]|jgi:hypothetical protein|nr:hypothetical protein [Polyangia bacterium]